RRPVMSDESFAFIHQLDHDQLRGQIEWRRARIAELEALIAKFSACDPGKEVFQKTVDVRTGKTGKIRIHKAGKLVKKFTKERDELAEDFQRLTRGLDKLTMSN